MTNHVIPIHSTLDLVGSFDDQGWYFQDFESEQFSRIYSDKQEALEALKADSIQWKESEAN